MDQENDESETRALNSGATCIVREWLAPCPIQPFSGLDTEELLRAFFCGKSARTIESYRRDLQTFYEFLETSDITQAVKILFSSTHRNANLIALKYRQYLIEMKRLKPKSVNRHLASLRSLAGLGESLGMIRWKLSVKNQKITELRDQAAPDPDGIKRLVKAAGLKGNRTAKRNKALFMFLYTAGLRRNEAISLNYPEDLALDRSVIRILGKGKTERLTICAVDGFAVGGGLEITMASDFVIATERTVWGMPEVDLGITPGWGGTTRMALYIGKRRTKEINIIGALMPAKRAVEWNLWNRVVPDDHLDAEVEALLGVLRAKNQQACRQLKYIINRGCETDLYTAQGFEMLSAGLSGAVNGMWQVQDADQGAGITDFAKKGELWKQRRGLSKHFWTD